MRPHTCGLLCLESCVGNTRQCCSPSGFANLEKYMCCSERYVQDHRSRTDRAIHGACARLASYPITLLKFQELLICARKQAPRLFEAPMQSGRHLGVEALFHFARFRDWHIRSIADWLGTSASWRLAICSLAHHLMCLYRVPTFMASV